MESEWPDPCGARRWRLQRKRLSVLTLMVLGWCGDRPYSLVPRSLFRRVAEGQLIDDRQAAAIVRVSWFRYEELVDDWMTFTTIDASKRGPLLKSRLTGECDVG